MYADMKTIRPGDMVFVHAGQKIYGAFTAKTEFLEDPQAPPMLLSKNIHYYPDPDQSNSGWKNMKKPPSVGYYRRMAIRHFTDKDGANLCYQNGFASNEVFELKLRKKIWSIPERWKYTDSARTVRPLMEDEALKLIRVLERENADNANRRTVKPAGLVGYLPIEFVLNPNVVIDEKIVEGWILDNVGKNKALDSALGEFTSFGNNMPAGYLRFMDIFGYQQLSPGNRKYKVIEVKKAECVFPDDINQLLGYSDWVTDNLASGDHKAVEGAIVARDFDNNCINFVKNFNKTGRRIKLVKFDFCPPNYNSLSIKKVV